MKTLRAVVLMAIVGALAVFASSASAVIMHLPNRKTVSYLPIPGKREARLPHKRVHVFDEAFSNLDYNGGPVMTSNADYLLFWRPNTATPFPNDYKSGLETYFKALEHDSGGHQNTDSVAAQYNDSAGGFAKYDVKFRESLEDKDPYPESGCTRAPICLTDEQIQTEIAKFVTEHGLPTGLGVEYFLLTPENVESCFEGGASKFCSANSEAPYYCAYHLDIHPKAGGLILYANDPFVDQKNCDKPADHINGSVDSALFGGLSHEHLETVTDPEPNNAWTDYVMGEETGFEIGDKCNSAEEEFEFGKPLGKVTVAGKEIPYNQEIDGQRYYYQQEWSNQGHKCMQSFTFSGAEPTASFTAKVASPNTNIAFDAGASTASGGVSDYSWNFNNAEELFEGELFTHLPNPFESGLPDESESFAAGEYDVALTVFAADGTSIGTARTLKVGGPGPTGSIGVSAAPTAGQPVSFDGSGSVDPPNGSIASYAWSFGDGSADAAGVSQSHTYAAAGVYEVILTVTGSDALSAQAAREVTVAAPSSGGGGGGGDAGAQPAPSPTTTVAATTVPDSGFTAKSAVNPKTGAITFTISVLDPGTLTLVGTFPNGKFGAFASASECKAGQRRLAGKCRPAKIVFAKGSQAVGAPGNATVTLRPSASALKALKRALKQRKGVPVSIVLKFQSSLGGAAVSHTQTVIVKLKR